MTKIRLLSYLVFCLLIFSCQVGSKRKRRAENHHQIAVSLIKECDHRRALSHLLKGVQLNPNDFLLRHTLAVIYFTLKNYTLSVEELKKIIKKYPKMTEARVTMARSLLELGNTKQALKQIELAEKDQTYSKPVNLIAQKGLIYFKQGKMLNARREFKELFSVSKLQTCFTLLHLGRIETYFKNFKEAEKLLSRSLSVCANEKTICKEKNQDSHFFLAQLYFKTKDKKKTKYHLNLFLKTAKSKNPNKKLATKLLNQL